MNRPQQARLELRAATASDHERVDRVFSRFSLTEPAGYGRFLLAQAEAFLPLEAAVAAADPARFLPDWTRRRRSDLLRADLAELDLAVAPPAVVPRLAGGPDILGSVYVLEGSRLGGAMLARSVPEQLPRRFLGASDGKLWRDLIQLLDGVLVTDDDRRAAVVAAKAAFGAFERSARRQLELADLA